VLINRIIILCKSINSLQICCDPETNSRTFGHLKNTEAFYPTTNRKPFSNQKRTIVTGWIFRTRIFTRSL